MKLSTAFKILIAIGISELAGIIGSIFTMDAIAPSAGSGQASWYTGIVKPAWNPPSWVFGPVWITLYAMMGIASYLVWRKKDSRSLGNDRVARRRVRGALTIFGVQLFLNAIWSVIFFGMHNPGWAFVDIVLLWIAIVATIGVFWRISKPAAWLLVPYILWVSFAGFLNYTIWTLNKVDAGEQVYCTMEAKLCSDGSAVGRTGPKCEFAACPEVNERLSWKTFTDKKSGITFQYPEELGTTYMRAYDWPPQVVVTNERFECVAAGSEIERVGRTEPWKIEDRSYCVTRISEGAAGSIYTQYAYAVDKGLQTWVFTATVRAMQCGNYDEPYKTACEGERDAFDFDSVMDKIIQTATMR